MGPSSSCWEAWELSLSCGVSNRIYPVPLSQAEGGECGRPGGRDESEKGTAWSGQGICIIFTRWGPAIPALCPSALRSLRTSQDLSGSLRVQAAGCLCPGAGQKAAGRKGILSSLGPPPSPLVARCPQHYALQCAFTIRVSCGAWRNQEAHSVLSS